MWTWDITKLATTAVRVFRHAYGIIDLFSRSAVGWMVAPKGDVHRDFCFGPDKIVAGLGEFLGYYMVRKVMAGNDVNASGTRSPAPLVGG